MVKMDKQRRQIVSKLVEIGVVADRAILRKGRKRKSHREGSSDEGQSTMVRLQLVSDNANLFLFFLLRWKYCNMKCMI